MLYKFPRMRSARLKSGIPRQAKSAVEKKRTGRDTEKRAFSSRFSRRLKTIGDERTSALDDFDIPAFTIDNEITRARRLSPRENSASTQSNVVRYKEETDITGFVSCVPLV